MEKRKKKLYVIPGLGESTRMGHYREIISYAKKHGFQVVSVAIDWSDELTMDNYINQAGEKIPDDVSQDYILGFSFGAYIAAILSVKKKAKGYLFCTISPYFKEYIKFLPKEATEYFGAKFMHSLKQYSFPRKNSERAWFFVGKKDWELADTVMKDSYEKWLGEKSMYVIPGAGHELGHPNYVKRVEQVLKTL